MIDIVLTISRSLFDGIGEFYAAMLPGVKKEEKPNHAVRFRELMNTPFVLARNLADALEKYAETFEKVKCSSYC